MGIDYSQLAVEINEIECGKLDCLPATLEKLLSSDPNGSGIALLREKQRNLARYARLFSYGLGENAFQHVDAMSALLVRARHYAVHKAPGAE